MLLKSNSRKKRHMLPIVEVNIVTLMDVLTTLLFFLIMVATFTKFSSVKATGMPPGKADPNDKKPVFTLQITVSDKNRLTLYLGPTKGLKMVQEDRFYKYLKRKYKGNQNLGFYRNIKAKSFDHLTQRLQLALRPIKRSFPHETKAVIAFSDQVNYQEIIDIVGHVRSLDPDVKAVETVNLMGQDERTMVLFPTVVLAEWNEEGSK